MTEEELRYRIEISILKSRLKNITGDVAKIKLVLFALKDKYTQVGYLVTVSDQELDRVIQNIITLSIVDKKFSLYQ